MDSPEDKEYLRQFWLGIADLTPAEQYEAIIAHREELIAHVELARSFGEKGDEPLKKHNLTAEFMMDYELITWIAPTGDDYDRIQQHHLIVTGMKPPPI